MRRSPLVQRVHTKRTYSTLQKIACEALRAAAVSDTPNAAIDVLGAALLAVASASRTEVPHG